MSCYSSRNQYMLYTLCSLFMVELLMLPSCAQLSYNLEYTGADDATYNNSTNTVIAKVVLSEANGSKFIGSKVLGNLVKLRAKRNQFKETSQNKYFEFWKLNDTEASISRWLEILQMLPKTVRLAFLILIPPDQISGSDLLQLSSNTIAMLKEELSWLLTDNQVSDIILKHLEKKDYRQAAQVIESLNVRLADGNPDFFLSLWNDQQFGFNQCCNKDVQSFLRQGLRLLPSPDKWNNTLVKKYGLNLISALPPDILIKIRDPSAAKKILDWWLPLDHSKFGCDFPPDSSDSVISLPRVQLKLMMEVLGENIGQWSTANISFYFSLFRRMSPRLLAMTNDKILIDSLSFLSQTRNWKDIQGYALVERLFTKSFRQGMNSDRLSNITDRLNHLGPYLLPEFLVDNNTNISRASASLLSVWANKMETYVQRGIVLPSMTASALLQYRLSTITEEENDNMTFNELLLLKQLNPNYFLKVEPWKLWKRNLNYSHSITSNNNVLHQILDVGHLTGSLSSGQIYRLSAVAVRVFRNSDSSWSMANTPTIYWPGANLSDYMTLSVKEILPLMNRFTSVATDKMNGAQLGIIYTKLIEAQADLSSEKNSAAQIIIKAMIPVPHHVKRRYTLNQLKNLAADMPIDSILRLLYAASQLDGKYKITVQDLYRQPLLVPHLSPDHINIIPLEDTVDLMKAVSSSAQGPPIQTVRILQSRLRNYTRNNRKDVLDNDDVNLLANVWLSNLDIYPATVTAGFSVKALKSISGITKIELLRSLGRLSLIDYYTIPRYKRITILQQGIAAMFGNDNGRKLNEEDMIMIGNAVVDMEEAKINQLTATAFEFTLPILQGAGGIHPCITSSQRSAIRKSLKKFYGYPNSWNLGAVTMACCSLNTLPWRELESIRDDLFLEGCRNCNADIPLSFHLQVISQNLKAACQFELNSMELENNLKQGNELVAKKRALAAFNTFVGDRVVVVGINNQQQLSGNVNRRLSCETVVASGSAAGFTVDQLLSLSNADILDCLYELGYSRLNSNQGTALWNRILQVYENDASQIPKDQLTRLGWILPSVDIKSLEKFRMNDPDVLAAIGTVDRQISIEKMKVLSNRAASEWKKDTKNYTGQDLIILGRLLCGMNASLIDRISPISYLEASAYLGIILCQPRCSEDVLFSLADKAIDDKSFGAPSNWTAAIVRNIGAVIGGLSPEHLRTIPASSFLGLTPSAAMSIPDNNFNAFKTEQIRNFPLAVAQSVLVRERQRYGLVDEMKDALNYVIYGFSDNLESSSKRITASDVLYMTAITFVTFRRFQII